MKKKSTKKAGTPKKRAPTLVPVGDVKSALPYLHLVCPRNILSFGDQPEQIKLTRLSVLVGPNGSGKSNLLDLIDLMRATPTGIQRAIRNGGGMMEWFWKGNRQNLAGVSLQAINSEGIRACNHILTLAAEQQALVLADERIDVTYRCEDSSQGAFSIQRQDNGRPRSVSRNVLGGFGDVVLEEGRHSNESMLENYRDPDHYPDLSFLASFYKQIRLYRQWSFGRDSPLRKPQSADARSDFLEEDFSNLGLVLNRLRKSTATKQTIIEHLKDLYEGLTDFDVSVEGGSVLVYLTEGEFTIPAVRLSDGTLRYLGLLALLCDPNPPPLIGIEEPELGLHPDLIPKIADLLKEASKRCQLIVTTHSDILVSALSDCPENVIVCEKHDGQTTMRHLDPEELKPWLEKYRLGELWTRGQIGGVRW